MKNLIMPYRNYKKHYSDCKTVPGTYDSCSKTIEVLVPDERLKPSGVRGEKFNYYRFWAKDQFGKSASLSYKAVCLSNALKNFYKDCKNLNLIPNEDPEKCSPEFDYNLK